MTETKEKKYMLGIYDKIFKAIMLNKDNIEYLKRLIHFITKIPLNALKNIKVENIEHTINNKKDKKSESDIIVSIDNKIINLEMDREYYDGVLNKNDSYISKIQAKEYNENDDYKNKKQIIQINFQDFDYFKKGKEIYEFCYMEKDTSIVLENTPIKYFIPLSFIRKKCYNKSNNFESGNTFEKYCLILKEEKDSEMKKIIGDDEILKKVCDNIEKLNEDKSIVVWYDAEKEREKIERTKKLYYEELENKMKRLKEDMKQDIQKGIQKGMEKGLKQGMKQKNLELAKKMKDEKIDIQLISNITKLSINRINSL